MECNKEEAVRAKEIAEKKMENKDFAGARKIAIKAQKLYPELENVSQMICVCDVHCSAESRNLGNDKDWYGVLQIEQSADDILIKKQYRKLALLLHPDKNKFAGAEAAFKLIGEAQRMLLDREKRASFDIRYRRFSQYKVPNNPPQPNRSVQPQQQAPSGASNGTDTFWTVCPFCHLRFRYFKDVMNKALRCQSCKKPFIAYDMTPQWFPPANNTSQTASYARVVVSNKGASTGLPNDRFNGNQGQQASGVGPFTKSGQSTEVGKPKETGIFSKGASNAGSSVGSSRAKKDTTKRRKKRVIESGESSDSEISIGCESVEVEVAASGGEGGGNKRRSSRSKPKISYSECWSDDDETLNPSKRHKTGEPSDFPSNAGSANLSKPSEELDKGETGKNDENGSEELDKGETGKNDENENGHVATNNLQRSSKIDDDDVSDSCPKASPEVQVFEVPDPDFNDFDHIRKISCFKVGQIWAVYDTLDAMPRYYAVIKRVFSSGLKMRITWLEPDPEEEDAIQWAEKDLPFSCGRFGYGTSETTEDPLMFSHPIFLGKGFVKKSIKIYPKKGETWAVFSNWQMDWKMDPDSHKKYEYEFVEILSDYDDSVGIRVAFLGKLKGFVCVFCQKNGDEVIIPPTELLRFSHSILSYRLTGDERKGIPKGSFELDPASLPDNIAEISLPIDIPDSSSS